MRATYDPESDAVYIYVAGPLPRGAVAETRICETPRQGTSVNLDFDPDGKLLGIELLGVQLLLGPGYSPR
jgi:uncharacterized protein YuzE